MPIEERLFRIAPRELEVMIELLRQAAEAGTLTPAQMHALAGDPLDIPLTFEGETIVGCYVAIKGA